MRNVNIAFFLGLTLIGLTACGSGGSNSDNSGGSGGGSGDGSDGSESTSGEATPGLSKCETINSQQAVVCGTILAHDSVTPLINAEIRLLSNSARLSNTSARGIADPDKCLTDTAGDFACILPSSISGDIILSVNANGYDQYSFNSNVSQGQVTESGSQSLTGNIDDKWVVVPGLYDGVQVLLAELKGCRLTGPNGDPYTSSINPNQARGSADCESKGLIVLDDDNESLEGYLSTNELLNSDSLFINCEADYSSPDVNSLLQSYVTQGGHVYFSDLSNSWLSNAFPDKITFAGNDTYRGNLIADIKTPGLASIIGESIDVEFDLGVWTAIDSVASDVTTFIESDVSLVSDYTGVKPLTVGWKENDSSGCVFYTSYHIEGANQESLQERSIKYLVQNISSVCQ